MVFGNKKQPSAIPPAPLAPRPTPAPAPQPAQPGRVFGIDVSRWQAGINYAAVKAAGVQFVYAKATDGMYGDPAFKAHRSGAKAAGLLFGAYHFFRFDVDPARQATNFLETMQGWVPGELPPALDIEWDKQSKNYGENTVMDDEAAERVWVALSAVSHAIGGLPLLYTDYYFWNPGKLGSSFAACNLWLPAYNTTQDKVKVPPPWSGVMHPDDGRWALWQYSQSLNMGGATRVDGNYFFGSLDQLQEMVRK